MIKLKSNVFYYLYTDGKDIFISTDAPTKSDKDHKWYHPDHKYTVCGKPWMVGEPTSSNNLKEWVKS